MEEMKDLTRKFETLKEIKEGQEREKIQIETQLKTATENLNSITENLLNLTNADSLDAVRKQFEADSKQLEAETLELSKKLSEILDDYGENTYEV